MPSIQLVVLVTLYLSAYNLKNVQARLPTHLVECYNNTEIPGITNGNNRPPVTINVVIDLIRKAEASPDKSSNLVLSSTLLQRFKADGIIRTRSESNFGIPYSVMSREQYRGDIQLSKLTPGTAEQFNNDSMAPSERCAFHYMVSNSIDRMVRSGEEYECQRTAKYTRRIVKRQTELLDEKNVASVAYQGNRSMCPLELGIVETHYGVVKFGDVLAGITAGFMKMNVPVDKDTSADNIFASTIAGQLAEAALYQGKDSIQLGINGRWNSTLAPRYYFLDGTQNLEVTSADLRGALDGFYLGKNISANTNAFSELKLSEILDLYYSPRGLFDGTLKALNRGKLNTEYINTTQLEKEVYAFMKLLDEKANTAATYSDEDYRNLAKAAVNQYNNMIATIDQNSNYDRQGDTGIERTRAEFLIFVDRNWNYRNIEPIISYILHNADINQYESKYRVYFGNGTAAVNSTNYLVDFYTYYNQTTHENGPDGFDYTNIFQVVEDIVKEKLNAKNYTGGDSTIALLVPHQLPSSSEKSFIQTRKETVLTNFPDLKIMVLGSGRTEDYTELVTTNTDVVIIEETDKEDNLITASQNLLSSVKKVSRAIVNPNCGSNFDGSVSSFDLNDYVEPSGINYYRIAPNYYYEGDDEKKIRVKGLGYGTVRVCISSSGTRPDNSTGSCQYLKSNETSFNLNNCDDFSSCQSVYFSVQGVATDSKCSDISCRFRDSIKFTISLDKVGCASGSIQVFGNLLLLIPAILFLVLKF